MLNVSKSRTKREARNVESGKHRAHVPLMPLIAWRQFIAPAGIGKTIRLTFMSSIGLPIDNFVAYAWFLGDRR